MTIAHDELLTLLGVFAIDPAGVVGGVDIGDED